MVIAAYPWTFGNVFCKIKTFVFEVTTIATALTILAFTFERWLNICKPMYAKRFSNSFSRALKIILFLWLISAVIAIPYCIAIGVDFVVESIPDSRSCTLSLKYDFIISKMILLSSIFLFIIPMTMISVM